MLRITTCMWGGMMCPLIPVMRSLPRPWRDEPFRRATPSKVTRGYLQFFEPDAFVETASGQLSAAGFQIEIPWRERGRFRHFDTIVGKEPGRRPYLDIGVGMDHIYANLFNDEFQFKKRVEPNILLFEGGDRIARSFFEACYGLFPEEKDLGYIRDDYKLAFDAKIVAPSIQQWEVIERGRAGYPLFYTVRDIDQRFEGDWDETIFIFDPLCPTDVIDFWNLRLFTRNVMPVNVHWLAESRDLIVERIREAHRPLPSNPNGVMIGTSLQFARSVDAQAAWDTLKLREASLPKDSLSIKQWYEPIWMLPDEQRVFRPSLAPLVAKKVEVERIPTEREPSLRIPALSPAKVELTRGRGPGWVNVVRLRFYGTSKRFADALPSAALSDSEHYPPRSHVVQIPTREGDVTFHHFAHDTASVVLHGANDAIAGWLKSRGIDAQPSDAGRVAEELIASIGGLWGASLLAHRPAIQLFDKMARSRAVRANGDTEEFPDRTATIGQLSAMLKEVQKSVYGKYVTLERFVEAGILRLGVSVKCKHCTKENWYSIDDVSYQLRCERCLKIFDYPQGTRPPKDVWRYRVIGPFSTPHFAQGAYAVALTLRFFDHELGSLEDFTYATSLLLSQNNETNETDFFAWHRKHTFQRAAREPALLVGECKSFGTELFKIEDCTRLKKLGEMLPGTYLVAAFLKDELTKKEISLLRSLAKWGWRRGRDDQDPCRLIVLTGTELFALRPLYNAWLDRGGRVADAANRYSHIFDLDTLAVATQEAHLGFTDTEMTGMRYQASRRRGPPPNARRISLST